MRFKEKLIKAVFLFLLGSVVLNLSFTAINEAVIHPDIEKNTISCFPSEGYNPPDLSIEIVSTIKQITSNPFKVLLLLLLISPPLATLAFVFLWKELEIRNKLKKRQI